MGLTNWIELLIDNVNKKNLSIIQIKGNKHTEIKGNAIIINTYPVEDSSIENHVIAKNNCFCELAGENYLAASPFESQLFHVYKLEHLKYLIERNTTSPIVRMKVLFSGFCSLHEGSETCDIVQLELLEKDLLKKLVQKRCEFRLMLNLDVLKALSCGFNKLDVAKRVGDLCITLDELREFSNLKVVIDNSNVSYEPIWSFENVLMQKQMNFKGTLNYNSSYWESNAFVIEQFNMEFDSKFHELSIGMNSLTNLLRPKSLSELVFKLIEMRISNLEGITK